MSPTLLGTSAENGDRVLTERVSYYFRKPKRWEVVAFRRDDGTEIMKRVVGLPGESVRLTRQQQILIDGEEVPFPQELSFLFYLPFGNLADGKTVPCGEGYYVMGDESRDSDDSRFNGPVHRDQHDPNGLAAISAFLKLLRCKSIDNPPANLITLDCRLPIGCPHEAPLKSRFNQGSLSGPISYVEGIYYV